MPERAPTLHEAMVAVLTERGGSMDRDHLAAEIGRRELWLRPSDGAPPDADQIRLRTGKYPDLFELSEDKSSVRLRVGTSDPRPPTTRTRRTGPARKASDGVWGLTENDVVEACGKLLQANGYEILTSATTVQRGPDLVARSAEGTTEIRVEAKGATSSKEHTNRFGKPFSSGQVLQHVSRAFYTAVAALPDSPQSGVRSAMAFPDTELHRARVEPLRTAIRDLDLGLIWVSASDSAQLDASWHL